MSTRALFLATAVLVVPLPADAAPSILALPRPYSPSAGGIRWEIFVTQHDPAYTGSLSVELPLTLGPHNGPAFPQYMNGSGGDDTNGTIGTTWYYNQTGSGVGDPLLWNISNPPDPADHTQNPGDNPFTLTETDGLEIDAFNRRLFASLGSTTNLPDALSAVPGKQVRLLHVVTSDGILSWTNAIVGENQIQYSGISGTRSSIIPGDMNASGNANPNTGAFTDPTTFADITEFQKAIGGDIDICNTLDCPAPGLNIRKRGDFNNSGTMTFADITGFQNALNSGAMGAGALVNPNPTEVPEPAGVCLLATGLLGLMALARRGSRQQLKPERMT